MSDDTSNDQWLLKFGNRKPEDSGVPLLAPYYSYLLKLSPNVGLVELYPWLAELMFASVACRENACGENGGDEQAPINVVSFLIDDQRKNIALSMGWDEAQKNGDPFLGCLVDYAGEAKLEGDWPRNFVVDTFGKFGEQGHFDLTPETTEKNGIKYSYVWSSLVGAGNPMRIKERFTAIGRETGISEKTQIGELNCFLINSISSLYRTMGFRDAMLLVRAMLQDGVWKPNDGAEASGDDQRGDQTLMDRPGMLFALLNEGVFAPDEIRYAETFFDGVFRFEKYEVCQGNDEFTKGDRLVAVQIERFPLVPAKGKGDERRHPDFTKVMVYRPLGNQRVKFFEAGSLQLQPVPQSNGGQSET